MTPIKSYRSPKTEIKQSKINGFGLFAKQQILKDEIVVVRSGHIINRRSLNANKNIVRNAELQISEDFYLAPLNTAEFENIMTFVNHACQPNLGLLGNVMFVAMRNIEKDEELTLDYAMFSSHDDYRFLCNCKMQDCRKTITGKDWMKKDLQKKYGNYFSSFLLEKIKDVNLKDISPD